MQSGAFKTNLGEKSSDELSLPTRSAEDNGTGFRILLIFAEQQLGEVGIPRLWRCEKKLLVQLVHCRRGTKVGSCPDEGIIFARFYHR